MEYEPIASPVLGPGGDFGSEMPGCDCSTGGCKPPHCTCTHFGNAYLNEKLMDFNIPIVECHAKCECSPETCENRVVQRGRMPKIAVRETPEKGRGVFAEERLELGRFICEYAGELLGFQEARKRMEQQQKSGTMNYILVFREHFASDIVPVCVDATAKGNIGRFVNHSCDPNVTVQPVRVGRVTPKLALFALRDIAAGDELAFDYGADCSDETINPGKFGTTGCKPCFCGAGNCKKYLPFHAALFAE